MTPDRLLYIVRNAQGCIVSAAVVETKYTYQAVDVLKECQVGDTIEVCLPRTTQAELDLQIAQRSEKITDALGLKVVE